MPLECPEESQREERGTEEKEKKERHVSGKPLEHEFLKGRSFSAPAS